MCDEAQARKNIEQGAAAAANRQAAIVRRLAKINKLTNSSLTVDEFMCAHQEAPKDGAIALVFPADSALPASVEVAFNQTIVLTKKVAILSALVGSPGCGADVVLRAIKINIKRDPTRTWMQLYRTPKPTAAEVSWKKIKEILKVETLYLGTERVTPDSLDKKCLLAQPCLVVSVSPDRRCAVVCDRASILNGEYMVSDNGRMVFMTHRHNTGGSVMQAILNAVTHAFSLMP